MDEIICIFVYHFLFAELCLLHEVADLLVHGGGVGVQHPVDGRYKPFPCNIEKVKVRAGKQGKYRKLYKIRHINKSKLS